MKKLTAAFLLCLTSSIANAETIIVPMPVICTDRMSLLESLRKDHDERPVWLGSESQSNSKFSLFVNSKNGTWTFIQLIQDQACILANGGNSKILSAI